MPKNGFWSRKHLHFESNTKRFFGLFSHKRLKPVFRPFNTCSNSIKRQQLNADWDSNYWFLFFCNWESSELLLIFPSCFVVELTEFALNVELFPIFIEKKNIWSLRFIILLITLAICLFGIVVISDFVQRLDAMNSKQWFLDTPSFHHKLIDHFILFFVSIFFVYFNAYAPL